MFVKRKETAMLRALTLSLLIMPVICSAQTANPVCSDPAVITRIQATLTGEIKRLLRSETEVKLELTEMSITDRFVESEAGIVAKKGANCRASAILDLAGKARSLPGPLSYRTYVGTDTVDIN